MTVIKIRALTLQEELQVEKQFMRLLNQGYIPEGMEDEYFERMMRAKLEQVKN